MSTDIWHVAEDSELADIRDENRLRVATAADFEDAQQIVAEHNSHSELLAALRELQSAAQAAWNNGWEHDTLARNRLAEQIHAARAAIAKAEGTQS